MPDATSSAAEFLRFCEEGFRCAKHEVAEIESAIEKDPHDATLRLRMVGCCAAHSDPRLVSHIVWVIENRPEVDVTSYLPHPDLLSYQDRKLIGDAWDTQLKQNYNHKPVLRAAVRFLIGFSDPRAEEVVRHGQLLEPEEPFWPEQLAWILERKARRARHRDGLTDAADAWRRCIDLAANDSDRIVSSIQLCAMAARNDVALEAEGVATTLLKQETGHHDAWFHSNLVHHACSVLGMVAVDEHRLQDASEFLLHSGNVAGSPQLNSFGPSFELARKLLTMGKRDVVAGYLALVGRFWDSAIIASWIDSLRAGETPSLDRTLAQLGRKAATSSG